MKLNRLWVGILVLSACASSPEFPEELGSGNFFEQGSERSPADEAQEAREFLGHAPGIDALSDWNAQSDEVLADLFETHNEKRKLKRDLRRALRISLRCGNKRCEADLGETRKSCPLDCGRLTLPGTRESISAYNMGTQCAEVRQVWEPKNIEEMRSILRSLHAKGAKKIRFVGTRHSASSVICSNEHSVLTTGLNRIIGIDDRNPAAPALEVEAGALLGDVWDYVGARGYSLGLGFPFLRMATIGGMISTGSHGSSHQRFGVSSQNVESLTLLLADGSERTLTPADGDFFRAAVVSLGNLGVVSRFRIRLEKDFNLRATVADFSTADFIDRQKRVVNWGPRCDFDTFAWFFGTEKAIKICWNKTTDRADPGAENVMLVHDVSGLRGKAAKFLLHYGKVYPWMNRVVTSLRYKQVMKDSLFVKRGGGSKEVRAHTVVGPSAKLLLSRHLEGTNPLFNIHDISFAIPDEHVFGALEYVDTFANAKNLSMPMTGVMLRFTESDGSSFLSHVEQSGPGRKFVMADFFEYRYFNMPLEYQNELNKLRIEFFKTLITRFRAVPHPAKNDDWIFRHAIDAGVYSSKNYRRYFSVRDELDPKRIFINPYFEEFRKAAD